VDTFYGPSVGTLTLFEELDDGYVHDPEVCPDEQNVEHFDVSNQGPCLRSNTAGDGRFDAFPLENGLVGEAGNRGADNWGHPEQPELRHRPIADKYADPGAAGGVDGGIGHRNADQVNQGQPQADGDGRKANGSRRRPDRVLG
jgi:hypothetical protein